MAAPYSGLPGRQPPVFPTPRLPIGDSIYPALVPADRVEPVCLSTRFVVPARRNVSPGMALELFRRLSHLSYWQRRGGMLGLSLHPPLCI